MNRETIIECAAHADREWDCDRDLVEWLETFAECVETHVKTEMENKNVRNPNRT